MSSTLKMLGSLIKWLFIAALAIIVLVYVARNYQQLLDWISGLFGGVTKDASDQAFEPESLLAEPGVPPRPFSSFKNPIGEEQDPSVIIVTTFAAADAWLRENVSPRSPDETPSEFVQRLRASADRKDPPTLYTPLLRVVDAYNRVAYANGRPVQDDLRAAEALWRHLR